MDEQHVKGAADKVKGAVKDAVGGATGDSKLQAEASALQQASVAEMRPAQ